MIRYIPVGDAINEDADEFAFYNTVTSEWFGPFADELELACEPRVQPWFQRMIDQKRNHEERLALAAHPAFAKVPPCGDGGCDGFRENYHGDGSVNRRWPCPECAKVIS